MRERAHARALTFFVAHTERVRGWRGGGDIQTKG